MKSVKPSDLLFIDSDSPKDWSLAVRNPELAKQWHPSKNGKLTPLDVEPGSGKQVWWTCSYGHIWSFSIRCMVPGNSKCPECQLKENSLAVINPKLAEQWHPSKNGKLTPKDVVAGSAKKVWWLCKNGHEWNSVIVSRNNGCDCPYCLNKKVCKDNCLETLNPRLSEQWHPTKNADLKPSDVIPGSKKKVWWKCKEGHEWQESVESRIRQKVRCRMCDSLAFLSPESTKLWHPTKNGKLTPWDVNPQSGKEIWMLCNNGHEWKSKICNSPVCPICKSLFFLNPVLAKEWHPVKNGKLTTLDVTPMSNKKVWWRCIEGHEFESVVSDKIMSGCPYCSNKRVYQKNSLAVVNPRLASEWHPIENKKLTPYNIVYGSHKKFWWKCKNGHKWQARVDSRVAGNGCPFCANKKANKDNCLATLNPTLVRQWHPQKNAGLKPEDVLPKSHKKVWWVCSNGHEYISSISHKSDGRGCPYCSNKKVCKDNCLATLNPKLASEWHTTKNGNLKPTMVVPGSNKNAWWICKNGHIWLGMICKRTQGMHSCKKCQN